MCEARGHREFGGPGSSPRAIPSRRRPRPPVLVRYDWGDSPMAVEDAFGADIDYAMLLRGTGCGGLTSGNGWPLGRPSWSACGASFGVFSVYGAWPSTSFLDLAV